MESKNCDCPGMTAGSTTFCSPLHFLDCSRRLVGRLRQRELGKFENQTPAAHSKNAQPQKSKVQNNKTFNRTSPKYDRHRSVQLYRPLLETLTQKLGIRSNLIEILF